MTTILIITAMLLALVAWNVAAWPELAADAESGGPSESAPVPVVSILIPARNEEHHLPALLESLKGQGSVHEILVYDDHSTDGTAAMIDTAARCDPLIRRLSPDPLPAGWSGKTFACSRLSAVARGEWFLFLDADARLLPDAVPRMLRVARRRGATFLSCWPGLDAVGFWEKLFMPMLNFSVFTLFPAPVSLAYRFPSLGLAHGACILARRTEYESVGGHAVVKAELFEDTALARAWRKRGHFGICLDGQKTVRVRMYDSLLSMRRGFEKVFFPAFRFKLNFWLFLLFHAAVFVAPPVLAVANWFVGRVWLTAWAAVAFSILMRILQARHFRYPLWSAFLHPLGEIGLLWVGLNSWRRCRTGPGVQWKGRTYHGKAA